MSSDPAEAPAAAGAEAATPASALIGTIIADRYKLVDLIGEGGMGAVYRGEHITLRKRVAVKFLHKEMAQQKEMVARFQQEANAVARLEHPNIVAANDFGTMPDGSFFMVMEYVEGRPLRSIIAEGGRIEPMRAVVLLGQIAAALMRAHGEGIIHRDLKPDNIIICDREGQKDLVKVIDFGIARDMQRKGTMLTQMGSVFGTPHYMSPEQAVGQPVDTRADQYALGIIAFEMFTGSVPYDAMDLLDVMHKHIGAPIPKASESVSELPVALDEVLERMMAKLPDERYATVAEAMTAIEIAVLGSPRISNLPSLNIPGAVSATPRQSVKIEAIPAGLTPSAVKTTPLAPAGPGLGTQLKLWFQTGVADAKARKVTAHSGTLGGAVVLLVILVLVIAFRGGKNSSSGTVAPLGARIGSYQKQQDVSDALSRAMHGDVESAIKTFTAKRAQSASDGLAAYYLGTSQWMAGRSAEALDAFSAALRAEPGLSEDPTLQRALISMLSDSNRRTAVTELWERSSLAASTSATIAVAAEAIDGETQQARMAALGLAVARVGQLPALTRMRINLRTSRECADAVESMSQLSGLDAPAAQDDVRTLRSGRCATVLTAELCTCPGLTAP